MKLKINLLSRSDSIPYLNLLLSCLLSLPLALQIGMAVATASPLRVKLPPPPARGIAGNRSAAASRSRCPDVSHPLTALVPKYSSNRVWGLTGREHPTFWFYIPYDRDSIANISFSLQDESNPAEPKIIYQNPQIVPPSKPGLMQIALPPETVGLTANQPYHWFLTLKMGCANGQRPLFVDGWIQRQELDSNLRDQIKQAPPTQQVDLYADNGLWYDALTTLANLRSAQPQDITLKQDWQNLLNAIDLGSLAD